MSIFKSLIGNTIYPIGFPVVIVTADKPMNGIRIAEFFILLFPPSGSVKLNRRRFIYENVPESMLQDEELLDGTLLTVQAELDMIVDAQRRQFEPVSQVMLPYSVRFNLEELSLSRLRYLLVHHRLQEVVEQIRRETYCTELNNILPQCLRFGPWNVKRDPDL